ncbi:MAG: cyclic nucleotide-binding domain-containing protein [Thiohalocapsa sp. PB-PSB1]|nr:MAG: hypothetical protein N838_26265 [Thiohalocapsa sp. PB-PSB1]QQO54573.1 MAG: cyclic nucleotide-binding domain-containing protein [Thiohalocapsa sp. PB-PSB1]
MTENRLRLLQNIPLFGGIREDILHLLLDNAREATIPEGEFLFLENAPGDAMYVLESGQVAILKQWQGIYYRLNFLYAGDCIGEMSLIDLGRRSASVMAMTKCNVIELPNAIILDLYQREIEQFLIIQMNMARELSRRLRVADESLFHEMIKADQVPRH